MNYGDWTTLSGYLQGDISYELSRVSATNTYVDLQLVAFGDKWTEFDIAFEYRPDDKTGWLEDASITQTTSNHIRGNKLYGLSASTDGYVNSIRWQYSDNSLIFGTTPQVRIRFLPRVRVFGSSNSNYSIASLYGDSLINFDGIYGHHCIGKDNSNRYMCINSSSFYILDSLTGSAVYTYAGLVNPSFAININNGNYIVCNYGNDEVIELNSTLTVVERNYTIADLSPVFVDFSEDNETLLITSEVLNQIIEVSWSDMSAVTQLWTSTCSLNSPQCATYKQDSANEMVIANTDSDVVVQYNKATNIYSNLYYYLMSDNDTSLVHEISRFKKPYRVYQYKNGNICVTEKEGVSIDWETMESSSSSGSSESSSSESSSSSSCVPVFTSIGYKNDGSEAQGVWCDGTYVYLANSSGGLRAYTFDGSSFTGTGNIDDGGTAWDVCGDGTYIYLANHTDGLRAYTYNGSSFTNVGSIDDGDFAYGVWCDGTYIYLANGSGGLNAYTFNGSTFTNVGHIDDGGTAWGVWSDGTYIYLANGSDGLRAYTFNGSAFTGAGNIDNGGVANDVFGDGTYIYLANGSDGLRAYTYNGSAFTNVGNIDDGGTAYGVWSDGTYIYLANDSDGIRSYTFNGSAFTGSGNIDDGNNAWDVFGCGSYIYIANFAGGIRSYGWRCP